MDTLRLATQYVLEGITPEQWEFIKTIPTLTADQLTAAKKAIATPVVITPPKEPDKPTDPVTPVVEEFTQLTPAYDEKTRALTFRDKGGLGLILHEMPGVTGWTDKTVVFVDEGPARERKEVYQINAKQKDGKLAAPVWFSMASYALVENPKKATIPVVDKPVSNDKPTIPAVPELPDKTTLSEGDETQEGSTDNGIFFETPKTNETTN